MKICSKCRTKKRATSFNWKCRAKNLRQSICRECWKDVVAASYRRNKQSYLDRNKRAAERKRELLIKLKSKPCTDCGVMYPHYVMDFDHKEQKEFLLARAIDKGYSEEKILAEAAKCDVVCSNCHRERTHLRKSALA